MQIPGQVEVMTDSQGSLRRTQKPLDATPGNSIWYGNPAQREAGRSGVRSARPTWVAVAVVLAATAALGRMVQPAEAVAQ